MTYKEVYSGLTKEAGMKKEATLDLARLIKKAKAKGIDKKAFLPLLATPGFIIPGAIGAGAYGLYRWGKNKGQAAANKAQTQLKNVQNQYNSQVGTGFWDDLMKFLKRFITGEGYSKAPTTPTVPKPPQAPQ